MSRTASPARPRSVPASSPRRPRATGRSFVVAASAACVLGVSAMAGGCRATDRATDRAEVARLAPPPTTLDIAPGAYAEAFQAVRSELRRRGYRLDRIDAGAGVITTDPLRSSGILTPFTRSAASTGDELREAVQPTDRTVRVEFSTVSGFAPVVDPSAAMVARIMVDEFRTFDAGRRLTTVSVILTSSSRDPLRARRGVGGVQQIPVGRDPIVEDDLARDLASRSLPTAGRAITRGGR